MEVFCWGNNSSEQLGPKKTSGGPRPWSWGPQHEVTLISCGERHTLILTRDGTLLSRGDNSHGQLGVEDDQTRPEIPEVIATIACGRNHCVAATTCGRVYSWGASKEGQLGILPHKWLFSNTPSHVSMITSIPVVQLTCGDSHSLALTEGGDVFSWGSNSHGQLGRGRSVTIEDQPRQVTALIGIPATQISAGAAHTLVLTLTGLVYCCGANDRGQLGLNRLDEAGRFNFCLVPALRPFSISSISCGESHSAALTKDGKVFTFGKGSEGQLGNNSTVDEVRPCLVEGLDGPASQIACGRRHTLVLGCSGQVWAFGDGEKGQMGSDKSEGSLSPSLVQLPWTVAGEAAVPKDLEIAAGWDSNFVFTSSDQNPELRQISGRLHKGKLKEWFLMETPDEQAECEIGWMFGSCSNLVSSFTKEHAVPPEEGALTVDLEAADRTIGQLLKVPWKKSLVNIYPMLNELFGSRQILQSPEIIILLLLFPFEANIDAVQTKFFLLAAVINELSEKTSEKLRRLWSSLKPALFMKQLLVLKQTLGYILGMDELNYLPVKVLLNALKLLYRANKTGNSHKVPLSSFHVEEFKHLKPLKDVELWLQFLNKEDDKDTPVIICRYPFVLDLTCKVGIFNICAFISERGFVEQFEKGLETAGVPVFQLSLRRQHLVEDTFRQLHHADHAAFKRKLVVVFVEDRILSNVNIKDFFHDIFTDLKSNMYMYNDSGKVAWFPPKPKEEEKKYFLFGVLCGLAVYNHHIIDLPFPLALFKKLRGIKLTLDDLMEYEPVVGEGLRCILHDYDAETLQEMATPFTMFWGGERVALDPKDPQKRVTQTNKKAFVAAYIDHAFNKSVERVFEEFKRGFYKVCDFHVVALFQPEELKTVMVGIEDYDWVTFKQNTRYEGEYHAEHPNIITFWKVFESLTPEEKKKFLWFVTGSERVHFKGMKAVQMKVAVLQDSDDIHCPQALICHCLLLLPIYSRKKAGKLMRKWLLVALSTKKGSDPHARSNSNV